MKTIFTTVFIALIVVGCSEKKEQIEPPQRMKAPAQDSDKGSATASPHWELARKSLSLQAKDVLLRPTSEERGALPSERVTVEDTISTRFKGWRYTWKVLKPKDNKLILQKMEAVRIKGEL